MIRLGVLCLLVRACLSGAGAVRSSSDTQVRGRNAAEVQGWQDNDYRIEETGHHLWGDAHHYPSHPRPKPLHHPSFENEPWDEGEWYDPLPWEHDYDPWEEPCVPYKKGGWSQYAYDDVKEHEDYDDHHRWGTTDWAEKALKDEMWWGYHGKDTKETKAKGNKGKMMKGMKGPKGTYKPHKPPKHKPPKPCPTKHPSKEPSKYGSGSYYSHHYSYDASSHKSSSSEDSKSPSYDGEHPPKTTNDIIVELSPFKIQFKVPEASDPDSQEISEIESITMDLLQDYFVDVFAYEMSVLLNFVEVTVLEDKPPYVQNYMITVYFRAKVYFASDTQALPSMSQLDILLKNAFWGKWLDEYHKELRDLPNESVFHDATVFAVSSVSHQGPAHDNGAYDNGAHQWKPKTTVSSTNEPLPEVKTTSTSMTPPVMVITIVSSTMFVMGALFFALHKQKAIKQRQKQLLQNQFPPPKDDGHSTAEVTMTMMEDEDSMVECELGDDNFSVGSKSTRRSRAENFLRLIEDDDGSASGRSRRFLVSNASRKATTWNQ